METTTQFEELPAKFGNSAIKRVVRIYSMMFEDLYSVKPYIMWPKVGKLLKPLLTNYGEYGVAAFICIHFNWHGGDGYDDFAFRRLASAKFPIEWLPASVNAYEVYLREAIGADDACKVKSYVIQSIKRLSTYK